MPAFKLNEKSFSAIANEDMSSAQYRGVVITSGSDLTVNIGSEAGETIYGVVQNKPNSGQHAQIDFMGITMVKAGLAINAGVSIGFDASGYGIVETGSKANRFGYSITGCRSGEVFSAMIDRSYV